MRLRNLSAFFAIFVLFFITVNTSKAYTEKDFCGGIIPVSSVAENYTAVGEIEKKIFGNSFPQTDIYKRLDNIETKIFGTISKKNLSDRVDDLRVKIIGENKNSDDEDSSLSSYSDKNSYSETYTESSENDSLDNLLNKLEKQLLNQVFPNDSREQRVARLEKYLFNNSSEEYPIEERMERLAAVVKAQPTNDIYQGLSQLGGNQTMENGISLATIILMIIAGLLL